MKLSVLVAVIALVLVGTVGGAWAQGMAVCAVVRTTVDRILDTPLGTVVVPVGTPGQYLGSVDIYWVSIQWKGALGLNGEPLVIDTTQPGFEPYLVDLYVPPGEFTYLRIWHQDALRPCHYPKGS